MELKGPQKKMGWPLMQLEGLGASREGLLVSWDGDGAGMNRQTERQKKINYMITHMRCYHRSSSPKGPLPSAHNG